MRVTLCYLATEYFRSAFLRQDMGDGGNFAESANLHLSKHGFAKLLYFLCGSQE